MSAAYISAIVALVAVIVSGVMQFLTVRQSRENTKDTLAVTRDNATLTAEKTRENTILTLKEARKNTMAQIVSAETQAWEDGLRADIAEFATITGTVETKFLLAKEEKFASGWPGEYAELVDQADTLMSKIWMRLDLDKPAQKQLKASVDELYRTDHKHTWLSRKERVLIDARKAFEEKWSLVVGSSEEG